MGFLFPALIFSLILILNLPSLKADDSSGSSQSLVSSEMKEMPFGDRKNLRGTVGASNKEGMALITKTDEASHSEKEMWLPFSENVRFNGYNSTADIQEGDVVVANYEEDSEGTKRVLREITFAERKEAPAAAAEEEEDESPVL